MINLIPYGNISWYRNSIQCFKKPCRQMSDTFCLQGYVSTIILALQVEFYTYRMFWKTTPSLPLRPSSHTNVSLLNLCNRCIWNLQHLSARNTIWFHICKDLCSSNLKLHSLHSTNLIHICRVRYNSSLKLHSLHNTSLSRICRVRCI